VCLGPVEAVDEAARASGDRVEAKGAGRRLRQERRVNGECCGGRVGEWAEGWA
jgi:hypothetical protein